MWEQLNEYAVGYQQVISFRCTALRKQLWGRQIVPVRIQTAPMSPKEMGPVQSPTVGWKQTVVLGLPIKSSKWYLSRMFPVQVCQLWNKKRIWRRDRKEEKEEAGRAKWRTGWSVWKAVRVGWAREVLQRAPGEKSRGWRKTGNPGNSIGKIEKDWWFERKETS